MKSSIEISDDNVQLCVTPMETGGAPFVAEVLVTDREDDSTMKLAQFVGGVVYDLTQTNKYSEAGEAFSAVTLPNLPVLSPRELAVFSTGDVVKSPALSLTILDGLGICCPKKILKEV